MIEASDGFQRHTAAYLFIKLYSVINLEVDVWWTRVMAPYEAGFDSRLDSRLQG